MFRELVEKFQNVTELPIEIDELRNAVVELGVQDRIIFSPEALDTGTLRGVFYQYTIRSGVYADPELHTIIVYPRGEEPDWQRVICAKELIHVCDKQIVKTNTEQEVLELANKIVGPFEGGESVFTDLMAATDKLAQYQALNLLFPKAARKIARQRIADGTHTELDISTWAQIPEVYTNMMLADEWDGFSEFLVALGNGDYHEVS